MLEAREFLRSRLPLPRSSHAQVATGSFDKTAKIWDANTGQLYHTFRGHATEIVCLGFNPSSTVLATGSMDNTAKVRSFTHRRLCGVPARSRATRYLPGVGSRHAPSSVALMRPGEAPKVPRNGLQQPCRAACVASQIARRSLVESSCCLLQLWDVEKGVELCTLQGHTAEIVSLCFSTEGSMIVTGSFDYDAKARS